MHKIGNIFRGGDVHGTAAGCEGHIAVVAE